MKVRGTTALVTGASRGIGAATAKRLAAQGAHVLLLARDRERLSAVAAEIRAEGGTADIYPVDLADPKAAAAVVQSVLERSGAPDILVNNAGAGRWLSVMETDANELAQTMALPYFAAFNLTRELLPAMKRRGSGHIVNVTSVASRLTWPGATAYTAARCAVEALTNGLRLELGGSGIGVTLAMFGTVENDYWANNPGSRERVPGVAVVLPVLMPEEVGAAIVSGIEHDRRLVLRPSIYHAILIMSTLFPALVEWMMRRTGWHEGRAVRPA